MLVPLLLASLLTLSPQTSEPQASLADPTVSFAASMQGRHARLLEGLELAASYKPSLSPVLRLTDAARLGMMNTPLPLDAGGGVDSDSRQVLALVLGLVLGFGTGHLVASDTNGFILFLVVDIAIIVVSTVISSLVVGWFWGIGGLGLLASHIIQGLDAYGEAGGKRIVEQTRRNTILVADATGGRVVALATARAVAFNC